MTEPLLTVLDTAARLRSTTEGGRRSGASRTVAGVPGHVSASRPLRIMLADPPVEEERYIYYQPTMGILYLLGALQQAFTREEVELRYLQGFGSMADHLTAIEEFDPDLYGL